MDAVEFIQLSPGDYAAASFLDKRLLRPGIQAGWRSWVTVRQAAKELPARCHYIFHISHVGSTLLARLLGENPALFSLREPAILRKLAESHLVLDQPAGRGGSLWKGSDFDARLGIYLGLWSRTWSPGQTSVIKATSFVCEMASLLMGQTPGARAILMFIPPRPFLRTMLGGAYSDITVAAEKRLYRLQRRLSGGLGGAGGVGGGEAARWRLGELSPGECVAMSWLSEMAALHEMAERNPGRVLWMDFERFLDGPEAGLAGALGHLGAPAEQAEVARILAGPIMTHYAKKPDFPYDAKFRAQLLEQAEREHAAEIEKGVKWLERVSAELPLARAVLAVS